jgi:hypothetical protein
MAACIPRLTRDGLAVRTRTLVYDLTEERSHILGNQPEAERDMHHMHALGDERCLKA